MSVVAFVVDTRLANPRARYRTKSSIVEMRMGSLLEDRYRPHVPAIAPGRLWARANPRPMWTARHAPAPMSKEVVSRLRQRMIEDMNARKPGKHSHRSHIHSFKRLLPFCSVRPRPLP